MAETIGHNLSAACESGFCFVHTETEVKKLPDWITRYWVEWLFGIVAAMMVAGYQRVSKHMRHAQKKDRALDDGMRALLRDRIISACDHYLEKGFAPVYVRENITSMYDAYHSLGGDGIVRHGSADYEAALQKRRRNTLEFFAVRPRCDLQISRRNTV